MQANKIRIEKIAPCDLSVSYSEISVDSPFNDEHSHIHGECEIYLNLSGDVSFEVENRLYPIKRGSVIITRPYEHHHCIYHSDLPHGHYWLLLGTESESKLLKIFFNRERGKENLIQLEEEELKDCCTHLNRLLESRGTDIERTIDFLEVIRILENGKRAENFDGTVNLPEDVLAALQFMDDNLQDEIGIREIAANSHVSVNTLERHFKACLKSTPLAVLRKKRLIFASVQLKYGASVCEAFEKSGFSDYSHFIAQFRRRFGVTPLRYKKLFGSP